MREPEDVSNASSSLPFAPSRAPSTMVPKKTSGVLAQPSTSKAPPPTATNSTRGAEAREDVDAAWDVVGAGGTATASPTADAATGDTGGEQHQQHIDSRTPLPDGHTYSDGSRSRANHHPPATPAAGVTTARALSPGQVNQADAPKGADGPRAPPPHHSATQVVAPQQRVGSVAAAGSVRS